MLEDQNDTISTLKSRLKEKTTQLQAVGEEAMRRESELENDLQAVTKEKEKSQELIELLQEDLNFTQTQIDEYRSKAQESNTKTSRLQGLLVEKESRLKAIESEVTKYL